MAHHCQASVLTCEDFRLHQRADGRNYVAEYIRGLGQDCDVITRGGGVQDLVRPQPGFDNAVLRDLTVSANLHKVKAIHLINHEDCGAYAAMKFVDRQAELDQHYADLRAAAAICGRQFPGVEVFLVMGELEPGSSDRFVFKRVR